MLVFLTLAHNWNAVECRGQALQGPRNDSQVKVAEHHCSGSQSALELISKALHFSTKPGSLAAWRRDFSGTTLPIILPLQSKHLGRGFEN